MWREKNINHPENYIFILDVIIIVMYHSHINICVSYIIMSQLCIIIYYIMFVYMCIFYTYVCVHIYKRDGLIDAE